MTFGQPAAFLLLPGVAVVAWLFLLTFRWRVQALARLGSPNLLPALTPSVSGPRQWTKASLLLLGLLLLSLAIGRPQLGTHSERKERQSTDVMLVLDTSLSMAAQDLPPSRLARAKDLLEALTDRMQEDRVGLITFAGDAVLRFPLTTDRDAARVLVRSTMLEMAPLPGTNLRQAIHLAVGSLPLPPGGNEEGRVRAIVLVTDGEDQEDRPLSVLQEVDPQVPIYVLGVGTPEGGPIPLQQESGRPQEYKRDGEGQLVITRREEGLLRELAESSGGRYLRATEDQGAVLQLWAELSQLEKTQGESVLLTQPQEQYQIVALLALLALASELLLSERRRER